MSRFELVRCADLVGQALTSLSQDDAEYQTSTGQAVLISYEYLQRPISPRARHVQTRKASLKPPRCSREYTSLQQILKVCDTACHSCEIY